VGAQDQHASGDRRRQPELCIFPSSLCQGEDGQMHERTEVQAEQAIFLENRQAHAAGVQEEDLPTDLGQAAAAPEAEQLTELPRRCCVGWAGACRNPDTARPGHADYQGCRPARSAKTGGTSV
jgi:hypothetical protein